MIAPEPWGNMITRSLLALALMCIISFCLRALFQNDVPSANRELISMIIGALLIRLTDVYAYHFNSTASSQGKDRTIEALAKTAQTAGAALAPLTPSIPVAPGESVTVKGEDQPP